MIKHNKRRWTTHDRSLLLKHFGNDITSKKMPTTKRILSLIPLLSAPRSVAVVRAQVHNYLTGKVDKR